MARTQMMSWPLHMFFKRGVGTCGKISKKLLFFQKITNTRYKVMRAPEFPGKHLCGLEPLKARKGYYRQQRCRDGHSKLRASQGVETSYVWCSTENKEEIA